MWWRVFSHPTFSFACLLTVFLVILDAGPDKLLGAVVMGIFWTIWNSYESSKEPDYRMGITARRFAAAFYALAVIGVLYLIFAPAGWKI